MAQAGHPTKQSCHIDIRHFVLQEWVECDLVELLEIETALNVADVLTKATPRVIFSCHCDHIFGLHPPIQLWSSPVSADVHALHFSVSSRGVPDRLRVILVHR